MKCGKYFNEISRRSATINGVVAATRARPPLLLREKEPALPIGGGSLLPLLDVAQVPGDFLHREVVKIEQKSSTDSPSSSGCMFSQYARADASPGRSLHEIFANLKI